MFWKFTLDCECGKSNYLFAVGFSKDGLILFQTICGCDKPMEYIVKWEDALERAEAAETAKLSKTAKGAKRSSLERQHNKEKKKGDGRG